MAVERAVDDAFEFCSGCQSVVCMRGADGGVELGTSLDFGVQFPVHEFEAVAFFLEFVAYAARLDLEDLAIRRSASARLNSGC